ncbi:MAG: helix-turn-helix transcriptional regulator [Deferrisomatales bacterium]
MDSPYPWEQHMNRQILNGTPPSNASLLNEKQAAVVLGVTPRCLQNWRMIGYGPKHVRLSAACCRYRPEDLDAWIESRLRSSTSEPDPSEDAA